MQNQAQTLIFQPINTLYGGGGKSLIISWFTCRRFFPFILYSCKAPEGALRFFLNFSALCHHYHSSTNSNTVPTWTPIDQPSMKMWPRTSTYRRSTLMNFITARRSARGLTAKSATSFWHAILGRRISDLTPWPPLHRGEGERAKPGKLIPTDTNNSTTK